jgi:ribosomal protein L16/L10AE
MKREKRYGIGYLPDQVPEGKYDKYIGVRVTAGIRRFGTVEGLVTGVDSTDMIIELDGVVGKDKATIISLSDLSMIVPKPIISPSFQDFKDR